MIVGRKRSLARWPLALLGLLAFLVLLVPASASAKPVLLLFHPGGFCWGNAQLMDSAAAYAKPRFQPVKVDYPLCDPDLGAEMRYVTAEAKSFPNRKVYAYGESAGGSLAARLAELGDVKDAAIQSPVADVPTFFEPIAEAAGEDPNGPWRAQARWLSPNLHPSQRPIRVYEARHDSESFRTATWAWINHDPKVTGSWIPGKHLQEPYKTAAMHAAIDYLASK